MTPRMKYFLRRIVTSLFAIFVLILLTFLLMHLMPGEPFSGTKAISVETMNALNQKYGLDRSIFEQFITYINNMLHGDFGVSLTNGRSVTDIIAQTFPISLELGIRAGILVIIFGIGFGSLAGIKRGGILDRSSTILSFIGIAIPSFIIGTLLQYILGLKLFELTNIQFFSIVGWTNESNKILPTITLAFSSIAVVSKLMRANMIEVYHQDYILTAKAKGLSPLRIAYKHGLKNAILPILAYLGPLTAILLTGTFVVENIFAIPGLGKYFVLSAQTYDYPVIIGTTLFFGTILILCNLIVDLLYGILDPRIELEK